MTVQQPQLPAMPEIGQPHSYYQQLIQDANRAGDVHAHAAAKVGMYVTLAMDPKLEWVDKLKYFRHALQRHCELPPALPIDEQIAGFYARLAELVRQYAGQEALRLASEQDDLYAARLAMDQDRRTLEDEAEVFFGQLLGTGTQLPKWFSDTDWQQLRLLRDQWI